MENKVIIALDFATKEEVYEFLELFPEEEKLFLKIGMQLYYAEGKGLIEELKAKGHKIFLDLKLHDIPNTVGEGLRSLSDLDVDLISVHITGGKKMLEYANKALADVHTDIIGITILTSLDNNDAEEIYNDKVDNLVVKLVDYASEELNYIVCSAQESKMIKEKYPNITCVCPGIVLDEKNADQKRVVTPKEAKANLADFIVVGRAITKSQIPYQAYTKVKKEMM